MQNEDFQKLVIEKLTNLEQNQLSLAKNQEKLDSRQQRFEERLDLFEERQQRFEERLDLFEERQQQFDQRQQQFEEILQAVVKKLDVVFNETAGLIEFRTEINAKLDSLLENNKSIHEILGEHEVAIRTLRRKPV